VAFDCWTLRAERTAVAYPSDTSVHTAMVQFAASRISSGHLPWTSWFPYIGLGSPQFLHYQSLASVLTGLASPVVSPGTAVAWTTYLLLGIWPVCVYLSARMFSMSPWASAGAAAASPFLSSVFMSGYEQRAYIFLGYGLWTQLFAMWCLPIAWGLTWRSISNGRLHLAAALAVGLTICMHFETGYLAVLPLLVWPWLVRRDLRRRLWSAVRIGAGAFVLSAWAWVPLLAQSKWSGINSLLAGTQYQKGYGATTMLRWLVEGRIFDSGAAMPTLTLLGAVGVCVSIVRWRRNPADRAILSIAVCSFLLECGRTTFGPLADIVPGHQDIYFRRFAIGIQLAWLLLAGNGLVALGRAVSRLVLTYSWSATSRSSGTEAAPAAAREVTPAAAREVTPAATGTAPTVAEMEPARSAGSTTPTHPTPTRTAPTRSGPGRPALIARWTVAVMILAALASGLGAVVARVTSLDSQNGKAIAYQANADRTQGSAVDRLVDIMKSLGPGRVYAGSVQNWGAAFRVGGVPVFKYLETQSVDVMVYSATTTTLMDDPEFYFDERVPGDYALFGVRYLFLPAAMRPLVPARRIATQANYSLWQVDGVGYGRVVDTVGSIQENRADIGPRSKVYIRSPLPALGLYMTVGYEGEPAALPTAPNPAAARLATVAPPAAPRETKTTSSKVAGTTPAEAAIPANVVVPSPAGSVVSETDDLASGEVQLKVDMSRRAVVALSVTYDPGWKVWIDGHLGGTEMLAPALLGVTVPAGAHTVRFAYVGFPDYPLLFAISSSVLVLPVIWIVVVRTRRRRTASRWPPAPAPMPSA
jgi:hypothetical protein